MNNEKCVKCGPILGAGANSHSKRRPSSNGNYDFCKTIFTEQVSLNNAVKHINGCEGT